MLNKVLDCRVCGWCIENLMWLAPHLCTPAQCKQNTCYFFLYFQKTTHWFFSAWVQKSIEPGPEILYFKVQSSAVSESVKSPLYNVTCILWLIDESHRAFSLLCFLRHASVKNLQSHWSHLSWNVYIAVYEEPPLKWDMHPVIDWWVASCILSLVLPEICIS